MRHFLVVCCFIVTGCFSAIHSQELKCRVDINSEKIPGTNKQLFLSLQGALSELMNNQRWTNLKFGNKEKIEATFVLNLTEMDGEHFKGEMQIQAKRPVYNSSYTTTLINYRDLNIDFNYREFEPMHFNKNAIENNLAATMAFYAYLILGLDFDSFSPSGGIPFYQEAQEIASAQQSNRQPGWNVKDGKRNRALLINDLMDENTRVYQDIWYTYHRLGLDEMSDNPEKGRQNITKKLPQLRQIRSDRPMSGLIVLFGDTKLDEIPEIYSKSSNSEKKELYRFLSELYPTQRNRFESLRAN